MLFRSGNYQLRIGHGSFLGNTYTYDIGRNYTDGALYFYGNATGNTGYVFSSIDGERMRIVANGNVGIGNTNPQNLLSVNGTGYFGGNLNVTGDIATNYSDIRLKDVSGTIPNALNKVASLSGFYYTPNDLAIGMGLENGKINRVGVSAQEIQAVLPEAVRDAPGADGYLTVQYERIVPLLIEAIKELKYEIEELKRGNNGNS